MSLVFANVLSVLGEVVAIARHVALILPDVFLQFARFVRIALFLLLPQFRPVFLNVTAILLQIFDVASRVVAFLTDSVDRIIIGICDRRRRDRELESCGSEEWDKFQHGDHLSSLFETLSPTDADN